MPFDSNAYAENEKRKVVARKLKAVPWNVQQFVIELLQHNGKRTDYFQTCVSCEHFKKDGEICELANARPPAQVIADGCDSYKDNDSDIPF